MLVCESESIGGQIAFSPRVENYPGIARISGNAFADTLYEQALSFGAVIELETVLSVRDGGAYKTVITESGSETCEKVIIATGVKHKPLGVLREDELAGKGVSYCAVCDGAFYKNKPVAVVGGGNAALRSAQLLSETCEKVYLIHRRREFRGEKLLSAELEKRPNIEFVLDSQIIALGGENELTSVAVKNTLTSNEIIIPVSALFVCVGQIPSNGAFSDIVSLDENGYIIAGEDCKTSCPGIYAAGDCRTKILRQLTTAAADGAVCAMA